MKYWQTSCKRCGYKLIIPENTISVVCGFCGMPNKINRMSSLLSLYDEAKTDSITGTPDYNKNKDLLKERIEKIKDISNKEEEFKKNDSSPYNDDLDEDEIYPENSSVSKIMTIIFVLAPFIAIAVDFFNLPQYVAVIVIFIIVILGFVLKKK